MILRVVFLFNKVGKCYVNLCEKGKLSLFNSSKVAGTASRKTWCKWCFGERNLVYLLFIYMNSVWGKELVVHGCLYRDWVKTAWAKCLTKDSGQNACPGMMAPKQSVFGLMPVTVATQGASCNPTGSSRTMSWVPGRPNRAEVAVRQLRGRSCKEERQSRGAGTKPKWPQSCPTQRP